MSLFVRYQPIVLGGSAGLTLSIGTFDSNTASANGLSLDSNVLYAQSASATNPGMVNTSTQTFAGVKTFSSAPNLSSLTASLPLQLDGSKNIVSAAIDLSGSQATGVLAADRFPALTGDVTTSAGSLATTLATVNSNVGSFTNATITVNAKGLITAASSGTAPVTSLAVATANGFAGSSSGGATPTLTLTTTITGILSGNGTAISAAATTGSGSTVVLSDGPTLTGTTAAAALTLSSTLAVTGTSQLTGNVGIGAASDASSQLRVTSPTALTGTWSNSASGTAVTGSGTKALTELRVGGTITLNGETQTITAIASDTSVTTSAWTGANSGVAGTRPATPDVYIYPNGTLQVGGTRTTQTLIANTNTAAVFMTEAASTGATSAPTATVSSLAYTGANANGPAFLAIKSRGTEASPAVLASGDTIGSYRFRGYDSTGFNDSSLITAITTETWGASARGAYMRFDTTATGGTTRSEKMRLNASGNLSVGASVVGSDTYQLDVGGTLHATGNVTFDGNITGGSSGTINVGGSSLLRVTAGTTGTTNIGFTNTGGSLYVGIDSSTGGNFGAGNYGGLIYGGSGISLKFFTNATAALTIDTSQQVGIGAAPQATDRLLVQQNQNADTILRVKNTTGGTGANSRVLLESASSSGYLAAFDTGYTGVSAFADRVVLDTNSDAAGLTLSTGTAGQDMIFNTGARTKRLQIDSNGNIVPGTAALATSATDGFVYIQSCAGAPSGVPTSFTGRVATIYDTTNNKLYVYNGAWKSVTLA